MDAPKIGSKSNYDYTSPVGTGQPRIESPIKQAGLAAIETLETTATQNQLPPTSNLAHPSLEGLPEEGKQSVNAVVRLFSNLANLVKESGFGSTHRTSETPPSSSAKLSGVLADFVRSTIIFPLSGTKDAEASKNLEASITSLKKGFPEGAKMNAKKVEIPVEVGKNIRHLEAMHLTHEDDSGPTVVLFHANAQTASHLYNQAQFYHSRGFNVLVPTMGGYPGSPGVSTSEESVYQDVEAVKKFLAEKHVNDVGYHGLSIGGALAFQAATGNTSHKDLKTMFVVADQSFDTIPNVCSNFLKNNFVPGPICKLAKAVGNLAMPKKQELRISNELTQVSDGLDNEAKSKQLTNVPFLTITTNQDKHMGKKKGGNLAEAFVKSEKVEIEGEHMASFYKKGTANLQVDDFISNIGLRQEGMAEEYEPAWVFN